MALNDLRLIKEISTDNYAEVTISALVSGVLAFDSNSNLISTPVSSISGPSGPSLISYVENGTFSPVPSAIGTDSIAQGVAACASGNYSVVGGGQCNTASSDSATVGGGLCNTASGCKAIVGGGCGNTASATYTTVGGGRSNTSSGYIATVGGGRSNTSSGYYATVGGGLGNTASCYAATVGGGRSNYAKVANSFIGGGAGNVMSAFKPVAVAIPPVYGAPNTTLTITGVDVTAQFSANGTPNAIRIIYGGDNFNLQSATVNLVTKTFGTDTEIVVNGDYSSYAVVYIFDILLANASVNTTIGGGNLNYAFSCFATVGGGYCNTASGKGSTVGGGYCNTASCCYATVGGGRCNTASSYYATIGGGECNTASGYWATVGGGNWNTASGYGATVGGGWSNTASGRYATVGGGESNYTNACSSFIGGGMANVMSAFKPVVVAIPPVYGDPNTTFTITGVDVTSQFSADGTPNAIRILYGPDINTLNSATVNLVTKAFTTDTTIVVNGDYSSSAVVYIFDILLTNASLHPTIGGGNLNYASAGYSTVGGGYSNIASGYVATVGGGRGNTASGCYSAILGGCSNTTNSLSATFILGTGITATVKDMTFVNSLNITQVPTVSSPALVAGTIWSDSGILKIV